MCVWLHVLVLFSQQSSHNLLMIFQYGNWQVCVCLCLYVVGGSPLKICNVKGDWNRQLSKNIQCLTDSMLLNSVAGVDVMKLGHCKVSYLTLVNIAVQKNCVPR